MTVIRDLYTHREGVGMNHESHDSVYDNGKLKVCSKLLWSEADNLEGRA